MVISCAVNNIIQKGRFSVQHSWDDYAEWSVKSAKNIRVTQQQIIEQLSLSCELSCVVRLEGLGTRLLYSDLQGSRYVRDRA